MFDSLYKIYYSNPSSHSAIYSERFSSPLTVHLLLQIKQFNHDKSFPAFFYYNQDMAVLIEKIYSLFADFLNTLHDVPTIVQQQFALSCLIDEVHSTSSIEGIHSTHRELKEILDGNYQKKHFSSIIKKYDLLLSKQSPLFLSCRDVRDFYEDFAHADIIAENPKNQLDGTLFRKEAADIHSPTGKVIHRGITPETELINALSAALDFLNNDEHPAIVRIAVFHYLFVYIHPFYDGNGRTARFISSSYIAKSLHPLVALRLAVTIKRRKSLYYSMLKNTDVEINCGDLTPFICTFLGFIADTIHDINCKLKRKLSQLERFNMLLDKVMPEKGMKADIMNLLLQASVFYGRGLTMDEIMTFTGKSRNTVKTKFRSMPVRCVKVTNNKKNFYKVDWAALRHELNRYQSPRVCQ